MSKSENGKSLINLSLYEKQPAIWDRIIMGGNPSLGQLSKIMSRPIDMDRAIRGNNMCSKWHRGDLMPTGGMEKRAKDYIENGYKTVHPETTGETLKLEPQPVVQESVAVVLIVTVPEEKVGNVKRLLKTMGCDVIDA